MNIILGVLLLVQVDESVGGEHRAEGIEHRAESKTKINIYHSKIQTVLAVVGNYK